MLTIIKLKIVINPYFSNKIHGFRSPRLPSNVHVASPKLHLEYRNSDGVPTFTTLFSLCPLLFRMYAFAHTTWFSSYTPLRLGPYARGLSHTLLLFLYVRLNDCRIHVFVVAQHATILGWYSCSSSSLSSTRLLYPEFRSRVVVIQVGTCLYRQDSSW